MSRSFRVILSFFLVTFLLNSCSENSQSLPELNTTPPFDIGFRATTGGTLLSMGTSPIIERGVCWSVNPMPTVDDEFIIDSSGEDEFEVEMKWLTGSTTYYVRSYAKTDVGIAYGQEESFLTTESEPNPDPGNTENYCEDYVLTNADKVACCISGDTVVSPGDTIELTLHTTIEGAEITWYVYDGAMNIIDGSSSSTVTVKIEDSFESGTIYMYADDEIGKACGIPVGITLN